MAKIKTYENNCMSLSCRGEIEFDENDIIIHSSYKGYPRSYGRDSWFTIYKNAKKGSKITEEQKEYLLSFDGRNNIKSYIINAENHGNTENDI